MTPLERAAYERGVEEASRRAADLARQFFPNALGSMLAAEIERGIVRPPAPSEAAPVTRAFSPDGLRAPGPAPSEAATMGEQSEANKALVREARAIGRSLSRPAPGEESTRIGAATADGVACKTCNDTHRMPLGDREVMCSFCPRPCEKCRTDGVGPYCETTPCPCDCHHVCAAPAKGGGE